ncbi:MAG: menaquinone-dependent protoporphyrinogen IX dehydrogenase [Apibacter sp.]|nr:menaquinone-dependent protoporphyrinogen IX dehydrogenase [Apibacter sp.]
MSSKEKRVLIIYSSTDGHTIKISKYIANILKASVDIASINDPIPSLSNYDGVIIGASIRYGFHRNKVKKYINTHYKELNSIPNAFFSISLIARNEKRRYVDNNPYAKKFLDKIQWKPKNIGLFGGLLNYPAYSIFDKLMIKLIMTITKGPTNTKTIIEYTDWKQVKTFAAEFNSQIDGK